MELKPIINKQEFGQFRTDTELKSDLAYYKMYTVLNDKDFPLTYSEMVDAISKTAQSIDKDFKIKSLK